MPKPMSLVEAATRILSEVPETQDLQAVAKSNQEPMHREPGAAGNPDNTVHDLGGATTENPAGNSIGRAAAALVGKAKEPGPAVPTAGDQVADHLHGDTGAGKFPAAKGGTAATGNVPPLAPGAKEAGDTLYSEEAELSDEEVAAQRDAAIKEAIKAVKGTTSVEEAFAGVELSDEFKSKIKTMFEAAVFERAVAVVTAIEEQISNDAEAAVAEIREELEADVDAYLLRVVEDWKKDNAVAIESGLRTEIAEEFIGALRELFLEHNMSVPEAEVSVVEELSAKVAELEGKLNEQLNTNVSLTSELNKGKKEAALAEASAGLTATQSAKLKTLAEGVEFTTAGEYSEKVRILRESVTGTGKGEGKATGETAARTLTEAPEATETTGSALMDSYVQAISLTNPK